MKTVMKKMFCLLLVAVMLVGVMPFAAFADTGVTINVALNGEQKDSFTVSVPEGDAPLSDWMNSARGRLPANAQEFAKCEGFIGEQGEDITADMNFADNWVIYANFTSKYCTQCRTYDHNYEDGHCEHCGWGVGHSDTCTRNCTMGYDCPSNNHKAGCKYNTCEICGNEKHDDTVKCCATCKETGHATTDPHCTHCNKAGDQHPDSCPNSPKYYSTCNKCTTKYVTVNKHPECTVCGNVNASATNTCHDTADCPYCSICWKNGDVVKTHKASAHCEKCGETSHKTADHCTTCGNTNGTHKVTCKYYTNAQTGSSKVKVYVNLYTSDVKTETKHLYTYENVSKDTPVYAFIAEQSEHIRSLLPSGYSWGGNVYDSQNDDDAELMKGKVGSGTTVHINAYSAQDLVYIYVHNSRSFSNLRIVQLHGKKVGETITKKEVTNAVSKYYNITGLSMYDEQAWEDYVNGASVEAVGSLKVTSDPYFIDVRISGTAKSGTSGSGYTADSTNPKTGDAIFAPVMILGLSASALAVLFYLNKKRAF